MDDSKKNIYFFLYIPENKKFKEILPSIGGDNEFVYKTNNSVGNKIEYPSSFFYNIELKDQLKEPLPNKMLHLLIECEESKITYHIYHDKKIEITESIKSINPVTKFDDKLSELFEGYTKKQPVPPKEQQEPLKEQQEPPKKQPVPPKKQPEPQPKYSLHSFFKIKN